MGLRFDHHGCGHSDKDFDDVSIEALGSDVVRLADHLGLQGVVLDGWSLGGAVVVDAAAKLGGRLAGLVLTGGASPHYLQGDGWAHGGTRDVFDQTLAALRDARRDSSTPSRRGCVAPTSERPPSNGCGRSSCRPAPAPMRRWPPSAGSTSARC